MAYKLSIATGLLGELRTRFIKYQPFRSLEEKFEVASKIGFLDGLELSYPADFEKYNQLKDLLAQSGLEVSSVNLKIRGPEVMRNGSFTSPDREAINLTIKWGKEAMDAAADLMCEVVTTCPLNDGYDYPFEMDYQTAWSQMVDGVHQVAQHRNDIKFAVEYKLSDPRTRSIVANVGEALCLARQTGLDNVGVNIDFGHALIARENPSQSAALATLEGKLFLIHMNDNDRVSDIDLITGMVHFWETLEFFYYLQKLDYTGWIVADVFPKAIDPAQAFTQTLGLQKQLIEAARMIDNLNLNEEMDKRNYLGIIEKLQLIIPPIRL